MSPLILATHGLFEKHSGGRSLHAWCRRERVPPGELYIAWATGKPWCNRCAEVEIATMLAPTEIKIKPGPVSEALIGWAFSLSTAVAEQIGLWRLGHSGR